MMQTEILYDARKVQRIGITLLSQTFVPKYRYRSLKSKICALLVGTFLILGTLILHSVNRYYMSPTAADVLSTASSHLALQ